LKVSGEVDSLLKQMLNENRQLQHSNPELVKVTRLKTSGLIDNIKISKND
jgi:hypothetical protein